jgi:hypothetical protein
LVDKGFEGRARQGEIYAKVLEEKWTGKSPTIAYWNPFNTISDNRIYAFESVVSEYFFEYSPEKIYQIEVQLIFRRTFMDIQDWKMWDSPDILMDEIKLSLNNE